MVAGGLLGVGVVGVDDPPPHEPHRVAIGHVPGVQRGVDRERQRLERREQQLRLRGRERHLLGQRAQAQKGLVGLALLRLDPAASAARR